MSQFLSKHIPILDGIRAYAVLLVCLVHFFQVNESDLYETNRFVGVFLFKVS
jgi:peptidoglycan/LPS O-acetylase OafA/YrhL